MRTSALLLTLVLGASSCFGAASAIGTTGNEEILEGSALHTSTAPSEVTLQSGVRVNLSPKSAGTVFGDHLVLEEGAARVDHFRGYTIEAGQLQIQSQNSETQAVVRLTGKTVEVASLGGNLNVTDGGALLTRVAAGTRMSFQQTGASPAQTGAARSRKRLPSDQHIMVWMIGITAAAALAIGLTAAAQGKSPF